MGETKYRDESPLFIQVRHVKEPSLFDDHGCRFYIIVPHRQSTVTPPYDIKNISSVGRTKTQNKLIIQCKIQISNTK